MGEHQGDLVDYRLEDFDPELQAYESQLEELEEPVLNSSYKALAALDKETPENQRIVDATMTNLAKVLRERRLDTSEQDWDQFVSYARLHPLCELLHKDPFTHRAFKKPRGYAGDAELMDLLYRRDFRPAKKQNVAANQGDDDATADGENLRIWCDTPAVKETCDLGRMICHYTTDAPAARASRDRCKLVARILDETARRVQRPEAISIASGHVREAEHSIAIQNGEYSRLVAVDSDAGTLKEALSCYGCVGVCVKPASIRKLLGGKTQLGKFDLVYSTGLFDYLAQNTAERLTSLMFDMLKPGGRLMIANVRPGIRDVGYMECFMDWKLVYRAWKEMMDLAVNIPPDQIAKIHVDTEDYENIIFLEIFRK